LTVGAIVLALTVGLQGRAPVVGDKLSPFTVRTVSGDAYEWSPGRATVLTFCTFWCDTWKTQVPRLQTAQGTLKGLPVDFLTISLDGRWTDLAKPKGWTLLSDPGAALGKSLGIDRVPYTFVVDPSGSVRWAAFGVIRTDALVEAVRGLLNTETPSQPVYLTFDDFPSKGDDEPLLDALRAGEVPVTFFCIGRNIEGHEAVMKRAASEGHSLQLHSWRHDRTEPHHDLSLSAFAKLGLTPTLYRPPGSQEILKLGGGAIKAVTETPFDYHRPGAKEVVRRVLLAARAGVVIQLHAGVSDTVEALPEIIRTLKARGLSFGVLK
jgi:peptidoglycan-N-acetylglucosamine deacetylase